MYSLTKQRIWVAGHRGMVGSALVRRLNREQGVTVLTTTRAETDLTRQADVERWMNDNRPDAVIIAAAKVGGIMANNTYPADFLSQNLAIQSNIIDAAFRTGVKKLLFLGSSCIYPKLAEQPIREDSLLTGALEPTNEWYAIAKIAGIKMCEAYRKQHGCDYISAMPTNLYGPYDNFDLQSSHVLPALMRKAHEAKNRQDDTMTVWGSGTPLREFMHVDDLADALVFLLQHYSADQHINVGSGEELSIGELAQNVADSVGFTGQLVFDATKPDGTPRKLMDNSRLSAMGWAPRITLDQGLRDTYQWFLDQQRAAEAA